MKELKLIIISFDYKKNGKIESEKKYPLFKIKNNLSVKKENIFNFLEKCFYKKNNIYNLKVFTCENLKEDKKLKLI